MSQHGSTCRRHSVEEKAAAVRVLRFLLAGLGTSQGTTTRGSKQLGYGLEPVRDGVRQTDINDGLKAGFTTDEQARMR
ncbi:hypothetical protein [Leucobacter sp. 7(1)]|uniref:hypothetical protein n=1 Tax=Leucobacter sp. 7(1) TaxID=1255613 RepID=UPI000B351BBC|nr:hypothetical protein [Leucobacter sp. 7(1)]